MDTKRYYMMGLPESGKTTFLVAFTFMLKDQTEGTCLHLNPAEPPKGISKDFKEEMDRWGKFEPLGHTKIGQVHRMNYTLYDDKEQRYILEVPDRYGEIFSHIVKDRYVDDDTRAEWLAADKLLFFVNLDRMNIGTHEELLTELPPEMQKLLEEGQKSSDEETDREDRKKEVMLPDQFVLVELLQILQEICKRDISIKFIISAWDHLQFENTELEKQIPEKIFADRLPFVYQYVQSHSNRMNVEYWGVSAQGSDLSDKGEIKKLAQALDPMERVMVVDAQGEVSHDLSKIFVE